ncbi:MAG TPA: glycoside hydrolase domain-containing protein, partial [Anaerolineales bacterium]
SLLGRQPLGAETVPAAGLPLAVLDASNALVIPPGGSRTIQMRGGKLALRDSAQADPGGIVSLSMSSMEAGWAKRETADCEAVSGWACTREVQLLSTRDGGAHWRAIELPGGAGDRLTETFTVEAKNAPSESMTVSLDPDTQPYIGHGFDTCQIPALTQMQTWWNRSPYSAVNLYIGGSARACSNAALSASFLSSLHSQGWRFIPTWVGPQAACSGFSSRMSWDPVTAYNQGVTEANRALNTALNLGLTAPDKSGTVIYYDLEAYKVSDSTCRAAANAFISGWVGRMQEKGNLGAVYGASCGSAPTDWNKIANVPDALWVANWYGNAGEVSFDRTATVWGNYCLSDSLWSNHQRLRQYAGAHDETWGGLTLNIDSNVLDGPVTVPDGKAGLVKPSRPQLLSPANGATLLRRSDIWLGWKTTGDTCSVHVWGGNGLDITAPTDCSQFRLGVRPGGAYSWQVTASNALGLTTGPIWRFNVRPYAVTGAQAEILSATTVIVSWRLSADEPDNVDGYAVYADGKLAGTTGKGTTSFVAKDLACNSLHSIQVRAVRQGVKSLPAAVSAMTPSCAPALLSPLEGSITTSLRPRFAWDPVPDATAYQVQVSSLPDFSGVLIDQTVGGTSYAPSFDVPADTVFYWRARAAGAFTGDWAAAVSFRTANPPSVPLLIAPLPGEVVTGYTPLLDWADSSLPEGTTLRFYQVRVATNSKFTAPLYNRWILASEFTIPVNLPAGGTYYWQVRAWNTLGQSSTWSPKRSFKTAP